MFKRRRPGHVFVRRKAGNKETVMEREDMVKSLLTEDSEGGEGEWLLL